MFKYCDDHKLPLLDFSDLRAVLQYLTSDAGVAALKDYGGMSKATVGVLLREMVELEQQGAGAFLGEPEFDLADLMQFERDGRGLVSVLELHDVQDKPALFSTFMMWMLARLYHELPEVGDLDKPKLVFFFDEAHLLFDGASKAFLDQVEQVVRLVRSKGVGVLFVTQSPKDVPPDILGQLGNRVQHALRAFTPDDEQALRAAARTFPRTEFYDVEKTLTSLGIGEAFVTVLTPSGTPTPAVRGAHDPAGLAHGSADRRRDAAATGRVQAGAGVRHSRRPRERARAARRAHVGGRGRAGRGFQAGGRRRAGGGTGRGGVGGSGRRRARRHAQLADRQDHCRPCDHAGDARPDGRSARPAAQAAQSMRIALDRLTGVGSLW